MADNVKLTATIDADSQPLQNELDKAQAKAQQTGKQVEQAADGAAKGMDRAAQSARQMGTAGATAGVTIKDAMRHPIQAMRQMVAEAQNGVRALLGLRGATKEAEAGGGNSIKNLAGALLGVSSAAAVVAKGIQALKGIINQCLIVPLRDGYKEMLRIGKLRLDANLDIYGGKADKWDKARKELADYYQLYLKASAAEATEADKNRERVARRGLEQKGITVDPDAYKPMAGQIREQVDNAQQEYVKALEGQERELRKRMDDLDEAFAKVTDPKRRLLYGTAGAYEQAVKAVQDEKNGVQKQYDQVVKQLYEAKKHQTPGEDFSNAIIADAQDALAAEYDKQTQALQAADEREKAAKDRLADAEQKRADIEARQADASRREAMQHTKDILEHQMGRFGFQLSDYDEENLDESVQDRLQRRRNVKLDARIEQKRQRLAEGRKVHWTPAEQRRLQEYRDLRAQGKALTAEEKAMQAAKEQEQAAKELDAAATAIEDAASTLEELGKTKEQIQGTLDNLDNLKAKISQEKDFAATVGTATSVPDYGGILGDIKTALEEASKNIYVVK